MTKTIDRAKAWWKTRTPRQKSGIYIAVVFVALIVAGLLAGGNARADGEATSAKHAGFDWELLFEIIGIAIVSMLVTTFILWVYRYWKAVQRIVLRGADESEKSNEVWAALLPKEDETGHLEKLAIAAQFARASATRDGATLIFAGIVYAATAYVLAPYLSHLIG